MLRGRWYHADPGLPDRTHLRFFTSRSAIALLDSKGLSVRKVLTDMQMPGLLPFRGPAGQRSRWYEKSLLRRLLPGPLTGFRFLIAADLRS